jgi:hypothetical protein
VLAPVVPRPVLAFALLVLASARPVVVLEATPGGIAMAVRSAREGLKVALVNHNRHLGGILSSGLGVWDTEYEGKRSPLYDFVRQALFDYYRSQYGANSAQYHDALPGPSGHTNGKFEPHVIEKILTDLVVAEPNLTLLLGYHVVAVERTGATIGAVAVQDDSGAPPRRLLAAIFADCTYEGDLLALAGVPYRVGREARSEYGEAHAGVLFMRPASTPPSAEIARDVQERAGLKLRPFRDLQAILPASTGAADPSVQAYNYRTILSSAPANRLTVNAPEHYDPAALRHLDITSVVGPIPNQKVGWNRPQLIGDQNAYVEGNWSVRRQVMDRFWDATVGLLYFLQHDPSVPAALRAHWAPYGLARDEFADNGHRPYEIYVREARRLVGRYVLTEHDFNLAPGARRTRPQPDAIAFTDWYMDSHSCTTRRIPDSLDEGKTMLEVETFPAQIPYRSLLPRGVNNLLVPVALSATHVAWGAVRLEPAYMEIGEAAGYAAALAIRQGVAPARIPPDALVRHLAQSHLMLAFFNDVDVSGNDPATPAAEYFAGQGFFSGYDARLAAPLTAAVGRAWARGLERLRSGQSDPSGLAAQVALAAAAPGPALSARAFAALLPVTAGPDLAAAGGLTRGQALQRLWALLP